MLFDSHAHINNETYSDEQRQAVIERIQASNLEYVVDVGFHLESSALAASHAAKYPWCYAAVGFHPHDAKDMDEAGLILIKGLAKKQKVKAIGEIGLDFHYDNSPRDTQRYWFRKQIKLANQLKMPIIIHAREADQEVMDILKEEGAFSEERKSWFPPRPAGDAGSNSDAHPAGDAGSNSDAHPAGDAGSNSDARPSGTGKSGMDVHPVESETCPDARVLLHCFSGSRELAQQYVKLGATISVAGPITYKSARKTVEVVEALPLEFLLIETDAPYLTPEPFRGKKNIPPNVEYVARKVAEIKGLSYEEVARQTNLNAKHFFGI